MTFLTGWRLALAADLLRESGATVGAVAHKVGYGSPFALSTAFKRVHGVSPANTSSETALRRVVIGPVSRLSVKLSQRVRGWVDAVDVAIARRSRELAAEGRRSRRRRC